MNKIYISLLFQSYLLIQLLFYLFNIFYLIDNLKLISEFK